MLARKIFIDILGLIIMICFFVYTMEFLFQISSPYLQTTIYNNQKITFFDFPKYTQQLQLAFNSYRGDLTFQVPTRQWRSVSGLDWFTDLANNMAVVFNWLYMPLNVIFWPIRLLAWLIRQILALLGSLVYTIEINGRTYEPRWYMETLTWIAQKLSIPYI